MTTILTEREKGMIEFMNRHALKRDVIQELLENPERVIQLYERSAIVDLEVLFQAKCSKSIYMSFMKDVKSSMTGDEFLITYSQHMSDDYGGFGGFGVFPFLTFIKLMNSDYLNVVHNDHINELQPVLKSEEKKSKEIKTKNIEKDEVVKVVEEKQVAKNEVGLFTDMFEGHKVRVFGTPDQPLFVLKDVCDVLGIRNTQPIVQRLDKDVFSKYTLKTAGGNQQVTVINEEGLYDVVMDSRKPAAKRFRKWVTGDVLPSIRKTGKYEIKPEPVMDTQTLLANPKFLVEISIAYANAVEAKEEAEKLVEEAKPKVEYHDQVLKSKYMITTTEIGKSLGMNAIQLNEILKQKGLIFKKGTSWVTYSDFEWLVDEGFIVYHVTNWGQHLKWTERGRKLIHKIIKEDLNKREIKSLRNIEM